jgi:phosphoglycerol transferase MdoB-like AlkP superfamily enzyme
LYFLIYRFKGFFTGIRRSLISFILFVLVISLSSGYVAYKHYNVDVIRKINRYDLFKVIWAPVATITNTSPLGYHLFDAVYYFKECVTEELSPEDDEIIAKWFEQKKENLPDNKYKGLFQGKNLLYINVESLENFVINQKTGDKEITPFFNSLLKNSLYFSEYYEQVNDGTSSDADFLVNTSVYPLRKQSTFMRFPYNTYNSLPKLLSTKGYSTLAIHPDRPSNWNWSQSMSSIGFDKYIDVLDLKLDEWLIIGLSDESYLRQIEPMVISQKQPFYTFMVTQSSHGPFNLPEEKRELGLKESLDKSYMGGYFESVHYTDKYLSQFIGNLDKKSLLDNTVVVISGDHTGIHKYNYEMPPAEDCEGWWYDNRMRIPLIIYSKGMQGEEIKVRGGQVDLLPTIAYLMGVEEEAITNSAMGRNLLKTNKDFAILAGGQYVGNYLNTSEKEYTLKGLEIADKIIRSNYFKFGSKFLK